MFVGDLLLPVLRAGLESTLIEDSTLSPLNWLN